MEYSEFLEELEKRLLDQVKDETDFTVQAQIMHKNGVDQTEIIYRRAGEELGLPLPTEKAYDDFLEGVPIEKISQKMVKLMKRYTEVVPGRYNIEPIFLPDNIIPALIPSKGNENLLETIPHIPFHDLQIIFKYRVPVGNGCDTVNVSNEYIKKQGWTEQDLLDIALNNAVFKEEIIFAHISSEQMADLAVLTEADDLGQLKDFTDRALIITNIYFDFGAASILNRELMTKIADGFGENLYIIPADIEACMLVAEGDLEERAVQEILDCYNLISETPETRLSDHIYYFDKEKREIQQIARPEEKMEKHSIQASEKPRR